MAESEMGGERTEEPSQRRLQEARERGQIPRSRELTNFASMIGGSAALVAVGGTAASQLAQVMRRSLSVDYRGLRTTDSMSASLGDACMNALTAVLPVFGALVVMVLLASIALGVVTRAAPQLNLFGIGFTITLASGFFVLLAGLDGIMSGIAALIHSALMAVSDLIGASAVGAP